MPTKETELGILFTIQENGNAIPLGKVNEMHITSADLSEDTDKTIIVPQERSMSFDFKWNLSIDFPYFLAYGKLPTNNWRRMHGYRPRRKRR
jgi:hypothetical protein